MWTLVSTKNPEKCLQLLVEHVYTLGRMNCDLVEPADKSISRKHAEFTLSHPEGNLAYPHKPAILTVKDLSKFGTSIQNQKLDGGEKAVQNGVIIKFGTMDTAYKAVYEAMVMTTSCLDNQAKKDLKSLVLKLGGHVISEWRKECSLLVMSNISVTVKVICALIQQKPIVTVKYVKDLVDSIQAKTKNPDPEEYAPPLTESSLNPQEISFKKNPDRATLFQGKTFLFISTKQFKRLNVVVELAGGKPKLIEEGTDDDDDAILVAPATVVMQFDLDDATQNLSQNARDWARHVQDVLNVHEKRMIADSELGYAILYCSTGHYCNPNSSAAGSPSGVGPLPSQSLSVRPDVSDYQESERVPVAAPIKVKEEPMSQEPSRIKSPNPPSTTRNQERSRPQESEVSLRSQQISCPPSASKRKRFQEDEEEEEEERSIQPRAKRGALIPETPEKKSASPAPSRVKVTRPDSLASESFMGKSKKPQAPQKQEIKEEVDDLFEELETAASRRRATQRSKPNEAEKSTGKSMSSRGQRSEVKDEVDDLFDEFDDISSTRRRRKARESQASQIASQNNNNDDDDDDDGLSSRRKRKRSENGKEEQSGNQNRNRSSKPEDVEVESAVGDSPVKKRHKETTSSAKKTSPQPKRNGSPGPVSPAGEPAVKRETQNTSRDAKDKVSLLDATSGDYFNKSKADIALKSETETDTLLPVGVLQQEFADLVIRKPGTSKQRLSLSQADGSCVWRGRTVKNFKKFRKAPAPGSEGLPRIIGGQDLVVHNRSQRKDLDDWFDHVVEEEKERDDNEKMAERMFNYEPTRRGNRR